MTGEKLMMENRKCCVILIDFEPVEEIFVGVQWLNGRVLVPQSRC